MSHGGVCGRKYDKCCWKQGRRAQLALRSLQIILRTDIMAETNGGNTSQRWTSTQAYIMAVLCLLVGCAVGYLLRGSVGGRSAPAPAAAGAEQQPGMPPVGMG